MPIVASWSCWWQGATPPPRCISLTDRQRKLSPMQFCPLVLLKDQPPALRQALPGKAPPSKAGGHNKGLPGFSREFVFIPVLLSQALPPHRLLH